jgi:hypothetical protein
MYEHYYLASRSRAPSYAEQRDGKTNWTPSPDIKIGGSGMATVEEQNHKNQILIQPHLTLVKASQTIWGVQHQELRRDGFRVTAEAEGGKRVLSTGIKVSLFFCWLTYYQSDQEVRKATVSRCKAAGETWWSAVEFMRAQGMTIFAFEKKQIELFCTHLGHFFFDVCRFYGHPKSSGGFSANSLQNHVCSRVIVKNTLRCLGCESPGGKSNGSGRNCATSSQQASRKTRSSSWKTKDQNTELTRV